MRGSSWLVGLIAGVGLVGFVAVAQDPLDKKPPQRELEVRVRNLEEVVIEQQSHLRDVSKAMQAISDRIGAGLTPSPETKGKFDGVVKVSNVSRNYDVIQLDNGFALEVAEDSLDAANNFLSGTKVDLYFTGQWPYPYKALFTRDTGGSPISLRVRLLGKP